MKTPVYVKHRRELFCVQKALHELYRTGRLNQSMRDGGGQLFWSQNTETKIPHKHTSTRCQTKISALCSLAKGGSGLRFLMLCTDTPQYPSCPAYEYIAEFVVFHILGSAVFCTEVSLFALLIIYGFYVWGHVMWSEIKIVFLALIPCITDDVLEHK